MRWNPIVDQDTIQRFLLTIRDKTKELVLEEQVRVATQSSHRLTQALSDLVSVRSDAVGAMLRDSHSALLEIEGSRDQQGTEHRRNYVRLHTMKGAARSLGLKALSLSIHEAEIYLQRFFNSADFDAEGFEIALRVVREEIDFLRDVAGRILKIKIDDGGGETRSLFEMLAEELKEAENLCRTHHVDLGGLVIEDRVIHWNPSFLVDVVQASRHALANSLDHGYFKPIREGRLDANQKVVFRMAAIRSHGKVIITFEDEGFGFDREAILVLAQRVGVDLKSDHDYMKMLLRDGLSTAKEVTQLSGRGAGLSAIQTFVEEWNGFLQLMDNQPRGSRIVITMPEENVLATPSINPLKDPASA
jgi:chemotaxis protein histidine kinase CheA